MGQIVVAADRIRERTWSVVRGIGGGSVVEFDVGLPVSKPEQTLRAWKASVPSAEAPG